MEILSNMLPVINFILLIVIGVKLYNMIRTSDKFIQLIQSENLDLECFIDNMLREALRLNLDEYYSRFYSQYNELKSEYAEKKRKENM